MARKLTHKADGLFYVTQQMLFKNSACSPARLALARWQAVSANPKLTLSNLLYIEPCSTDETQVPVTAELVNHIQSRAGGIHSWMCNRVRGYNDANLDRFVTPFRVDPTSTLVMDVLYLLAKRRGLIE